MQLNTIQPKSWPARVDGNGRVVLPSEARKECDWADGTDLVIEKLNDNTLRLTSFDQFVAMVQSHFQSQFGERNLVDELIAERRLEASHE